MKIREAVGAALVAIVLLHIVVVIPVYLAFGVATGLMLSGVIVGSTVLLMLGVWLMTKEERR